MSIRESVIVPGGFIFQDKYADSILFFPGDASSHGGSEKARCIAPLPSEHPAFTLCPPEKKTQENNTPGLPSSQKIKNGAHPWPWWRSGGSRRGKEGKTTVSLGCWSWRRGALRQNFSSLLCCNLGAAGAICHRIWGAHFSSQSLSEK